VIAPNGKAYATYVQLDRTLRLGIFGLLMRGIVGIPVPDETLLVFTGYLIFKHELDPLPAFASGFLGSICGISRSRP
jgi:membrane protein DedA with SNARE-associated domain